MPTPEEIDQLWSEGKGRCSYCIDMDDDEFFLMCDCSRAYYEKTGQQLYVEVIGRPETATQVFPEQTPP